MTLKISMIFPGQGVQRMQNIFHLNNYNKIIQYTFEEASEYLNYNIWKAIQKPWNILIQKKYIQPIILTTSIAIYRFWKNSGGINPSIASGHSLGEYAVLICSNAIKFSEGLLLVKKREHMMIERIQKLQIQMQAIVGLKKKIILKIFKKHTLNKLVNISNINSNNQIIISGYKNYVQKISLKCKKLGAKTIILPINVAAHCTIMKKIKKKFLSKVKKLTIQKTQYPVINSITVKQQNTKNTILNNLTKQLFQPVQWEKTMNIITSTSDIVLEVSTNDTLTKLHCNKNYTAIIPINNFENINFILNLLE